MASKTDTPVDETANVPTPERAAQLTMGQSPKEDDHGQETDPEAADVDHGDPAA